jgi:hypothetical protein
VRVGSGPIGSGLVNRSACLTGSFGEGGDITFDARRVGDELDQRHQGARDVCFTRPPKADIHQHERHEASGMNGSNGWKQKSPDCHLPGLQLLTVSATGARRNMRAGEATLSDSLECPEQHIGGAANQKGDRGRNLGLGVRASVRIR